MQMHNFNSGPALLPKEVMDQAAQAVINFNNSGLSILEIGHRTPLFESVLREAQSLVKELMQIGDEYEVLFLHGGATTQFMQVPINFLDSGKTAAYMDNGIWGAKAIKEAKLYGNVDVVASSKDKNHTYINKNVIIPADASYLHITTNNTVEGTQFQIDDWPHTDVPLVADMSSDIFSRPFPYNKFSLIYAGAQKNIGAAGVALVVVKKSILGKVNRTIPAFFDYNNHIEARALLNTPPVFAIYVCMLTLRWIKSNGGLVEMERKAKERAALLYNTIDRLPAFNATVAKEDRSLMNAVFVMNDSSREKDFLDLCKSNGMVGVKGHRSVGGLRVSMYNAMPLTSVEALCRLMEGF